MKLGLFYQLPATPPQTDAGRYRETIDQIRHGERLGFATAWLAEGHFRPTFSILPAPLLLAAHLAAVTERIRLGTAVVQLPLHHPLRVAEEALMVDLLSGGRLELGVGRGSSEPLSVAFGQEWATRPERFLEGLEVIAQAWTAGVVDLQGEHYRLAALPVHPRPVQPPPPPLHIAANHPEMATLTGRLGLRVLLGAAIHPPPIAFYEQIARYREAFRPTAGGPAAPRIGAVFWVFPGRDLADVRARIAHHLAMNHLAARLGFDEIAATFGIFGSPAACAERIAAIQARARLDELICHFNPSGLIPHEQVMAAMTLFMADVRPRLSAAGLVP